MDPERRADLTARREANKGMISREEQRRALWGLDETLAAAGTPFRLWYRDDPERPSWRPEAVPAGLFHLDWSAVEGAARDAVFEDERARYACAALASRVPPDGRVLVVPGNGAAPLIELTRADFAKHAELLTDIDSEMWLSGAPDWLIEFRKWDAHLFGLSVSWPPASG